MRPDPEETRRRSEPRRNAAWSLVGGVIGFVLAYMAYTWLNPMLEARTDWLRELQGLLFTTVLVAAVFGAALGWWIAGRFAR